MRSEALLETPISHGFVAGRGVVVYQRSKRSVTREGFLKVEEENSMGGNRPPATIFRKAGCKVARDLDIEGSRRQGGGGKTLSVYSGVADRRKRRRDRLTCVEGKSAQEQKSTGGIRTEGIRN